MATIVFEFGDAVNFKNKNLYEASMFKFSKTVMPSTEFTLLPNRVIGSSPDHPIFFS